MQSETKSTADLIFDLRSCAEANERFDFRAELCDLTSQAANRLAELDAVLNNPQTVEFFSASRAECAHQIQRWGTVHDRAKEPADWFWLVGYLAGKALAAHVAGDTEKALHHTISSAAVLANWHAAISLARTGMSPGHSDLQAFLQRTFGVELAA